jgi:hypothetical protein
MELLEQCALLLGSATVLLGVFRAYRNTVFAPAYCRVSDRSRGYQQDNDNLRRKLWAIAPEAVITSNLFW